MGKNLVHRDMIPRIEEITRYLIPDLASIGWGVSFIQGEGVHVEKKLADAADWNSILRTENAPGGHGAGLLLWLYKLDATQEAKGLIKVQPWMLPDLKSARLSRTPNWNLTREQYSYPYDQRIKKVLEDLKKKEIYYLAMTIENNPFNKPRRYSFGRYSHIPEKVWQLDKRWRRGDRIKVNATRAAYFVFLEDLKGMLEQTLLHKLENE